jgi:ABC-type Na+ efflux pump permease subunit
MFLRIKTKIYMLKTKSKFVLIIMLILAIGAVIIAGFMLKAKKTDLPAAGRTKTEEEGFQEKDNLQEGISGRDIKNKYKEVKGKDFALLVTTNDLLKGIDEGEKKEYYRYILENDNSNRISLIKDEEGSYRDAVFINYNRLLKDTVVIKDISGGYIAPYGFSDKSETKFNKYSESKSIAIDEEAVFSEYPIYDGSYNEIGILYIEK